MNDESQGSDPAMEEPQEEAREEGGDPGTDEDRRAERDPGAERDSRAEGKSAVTGEEDLPPEIRDRLEELERLRDKHLRLAAEFDNYRKRTRRELAGQRKEAQAALAGELLDVLDDFSRVTESARESEDAAALREGVEMVERKFRRILEEAGLSRIDAGGERFDPHEHEALTTTPVDDPDEDGVVSQVLVEGYRFGDRLLRPARVEVQKYRDPEAPEASDGHQEGNDDASES